MGWILGSLAATALEIVISLTDWISGMFANFQLSIGWGFGTQDLFHKVFPNAGDFKLLFVVTGILFIVGVLIFKFFYGIIGPSDEVEAPLSMLGSAVAASVLVASSYQIFIIVEKIANNIYLLFRGQYHETADGLSDSFFSRWEPAKLVRNSSAIGLGDDVGAIGQLVLTIILLLLFCALLYQLVSFLAEFYMRYVVLGVLFYTCPLAFSCFAFKSTRNIFWNWVRMVGAQFFLLMFSLFFMGVFNSALVNLAENSAENDYLFASDQQLITTMFILIGWLVVAQKMDNYLSSLGLSVAHTGSGLWQAILAGKTISDVAKKTGKNAYKAGKWGAGKIGDAIGKATGREDKKEYRGQLEKDTHAMATAQKRDGVYTKEGAEQLLGTETVSMQGTEAHQAAEVLGMTPDKAGINEEMAKDIDPSKTTIGEGKVEYRDKNNALLGSVAKEGTYEAPEDVAMKQVPLGNGQYGERAVTQTDLDQDMDSIMEGCINNPDNKNMSYERDGNNRIIGEDSETGAFVQYAPANMVEADPALGEISYGTAPNGTPIIEQDITRALHEAKNESIQNTNSAMEHLNSNSDGITWKNTDAQGNTLPAGTFYGYDSDNVPVQQGALKDYATFDKAKGAVNTVSVPDGPTVNVQSLGQNVEPGFASTTNAAVNKVSFKNTKNVAASPKLENRSNGPAVTMSETSSMIQRAPGNWNRFSNQSRGIGGRNNKPNKPSNNKPNKPSSGTRKRK